jgi:isopentenyldiphosphate isomerase
MIKAFEDYKRLFGRRSYHQVVIDYARTQKKTEPCLKFLNQEFVKSMKISDQKKYTEKLWVFNEDQKIMGAANYWFVMKTLLIHGGVSIFLVDIQNKKILLQKRNPQLPQGDKWDPSSSGHLSANKKSLIQEAFRELREEIGIKKNEVELKSLRALKPYRNDNETAYSWGAKKTLFFVFRAIAKNPQKLKFKLNPDEVTEVKWFSIEEIKSLPEIDVSHALRGALLNINFENLLK